MKFLSLQPFVPSGENFEASKRLFQELGFAVGWVKARHARLCSREVANILASFFKYKNNKC